MTPIKEAQNGGGLTSTNTPKRQKSVPVVAAGFDVERWKYFPLSQALVAFWGYLDMGNEGVTRLLRQSITNIDTMRTLKRIPSIGRLSLTRGL